ncbi:unnamed protein product [Phaedon cochleariae]|uniref:Equilibrative nucleoside transporter n=1 Tax=Phaedon cochleariae TaxID=80249 RepID=A0A9P0DP68_PHACE|nr:unnamed protein product [Phaedon cochleariae]
MEDTISRRESRRSVTSISGHMRHSSTNHPEELKPVPRDNFFICHLLCFFIGFMQLMPLMFIGTAANYWLYKFRNTTIEDQSGENRTELQSLYQSSAMVAQTTPAIIFTLTSTLFGHRFDARKMSIGCLSVLIALFTVFTVFTQVNTDSWQTGFFFTTMALLAFINATVATFQIATLVIVSRFPRDYMKAFLLGQAGNIMSDILQVISITFTDSDVTGALIFFTAGIFLIITNLVLFLVAPYTEAYKEYVMEEEKTGNGGAQKINWSESKQVVKGIWPALALMSLALLCTYSIHPSVTTLVVSEFSGEKTAWTTKYFVPVITYTLGDASGVVARLATVGSLTRSNYPIWLGGAALRCIIFILFPMFCNAQPRPHNLPVLFNHDWEFILFMIVFQASNGFIFNIAFLSLKELSGERTEAALKLTLIIMSVIGAIFSSFGILVVKLL